MVGRKNELAFLAQIVFDALTYCRFANKVSPHLVLGKFIHFLRFFFTSDHQTFVQTRVVTISNYNGKRTVQWLRQKTHDRKVLGSNPFTAYSMNVMIWHSYDKSDLKHFAKTNVWTLEKNCFFGVTGLRMLITLTPKLWYLNHKKTYCNKNHLDLLIFFSELRRRYDKKF